MAALEVDKRVLDNLVKLFEKKEVSLRKTLPSFNPIEIFIKKVSRKEDAHSDLIASLLNPMGDHRQGDIFLRNFIRKCVGKTILYTSINWDTVSIARERGVYNQKGSRRKIDILIQGRLYGGVQEKDEEFAIIVENKLNGAKYQINQLEDYRASINREIGNPNNVWIVCLLQSRFQRNKESDRNLLACDLGNLIDESFSNNAEISVALKAYTTYLRNMNIMTMTIDKAKKLSNLQLNQNDLHNISALWQVLNSLPEAFLTIFVKEYLKVWDVNEKYSIEMPKNDPGYLFIWNETSYREKETWQFLALQFLVDRVKFYLVSNDSLQEDRDRKAKNIGFCNPENYKGWTWYSYSKPLELPIELMFTKSAESPIIPKYEEILTLTKRYLILLDKTAVK